jgi:type III restriction enzyme
MEENGAERLYLVAETKGSMDQAQLRQTEQEKVFCAQKHFEAVGNDVRYEGIVDSYMALQTKIA